VPPVSGITLIVPELFFLIVCLPGYLLFTFFELLVLYFFNRRIIVRDKSPYGGLSCLN